MKIGIPLSENIIAVRQLLAPSFQHTSLLGIYDCDQNTLETIHLEQNGHSIDFSELLKEHEIKAVISPDFTIMVLKLFKGLKIITFRASDSDVADNIKLFKNGELARYTFVDAAKANCTADACGSCQTLC